MTAGLANNRGLFIVLEGGEGSGKSRLQQSLAERLTADGLRVVTTREPGGTPIGERIRDLLLADISVDDPLAELLLFQAARAHLVQEVIRPSLEAGALVLCDRFAASSIAYQSAGRGLPRDVVERANEIATGGLAPDLTLLLDLPVEQGLARRSAGGGENAFDREDIAFHERVHTAYLDLARTSPDTWRIIDACQPFEAVLDAAHTAVRERIAGGDGLAQDITPD